MHPVLFTIGDFSFRFYGLMIAIGTLLGYWFVTTKKKDIALTDDDLLDLLLWLIIMCIIGAKIVFILTHNPLYYIQNPKDILSGSGLSFIGIVIFGLGTRGFTPKEKSKLFRPPRYTFSRCDDWLYHWKNWVFLNGCCFGLPTESWIGFRFIAVDPYPRYPTQLFIAAGALISFSSCSGFTKTKNQMEKCLDGSLSCIPL